MGRPDGAHTHGGGSGLGDILAALGVLLVAAAVAGPVIAAVGELIHVLVIVAGVIVGIGAVCVGGLLAWRWRRPALDAARTAPPAFASAKVVRAAPPLPRERQTPELTATTGQELPGSLHLHFHGVSDDDVAAIMDRHRQAG
jgi:hypothetical protein